MKKIILVSMLAIAALSVANEKREVEEVRTCTKKLDKEI